MNNIKKEAFRSYYLEGEKPKQDIVNIRLNDEQRLLLENAKKVLEQKKDSTALKQLATIGANVVLDKKMSSILEMVFINKRRNKRTGIHDFD